MYEKINYTLVGLFVTLFVLATVMFGFWLLRYGFERDYDYYNIYFSESVNGLSIDSTVKLKGVEVGKVASINIDEESVDRVKVLIKLNRGTPITEDMYAVLNLQGITGLSYVEIRGGKRGSKPLKTDPKSPAVIPSEPSLANRVIDEVPQVVDKIVRAVDAFNTLLNSKNIANISEILESTKIASKKVIKLEDNYISLAKELNKTVVLLRADVNGTIRNLNSITTKIDNRLDSLIESVEDSTDSITSLSRAINKKLRRGEYDLKKIVRPIEVDLKELSYQYQELANSLKSITTNPSSLIFGSGKLRRGPGE
jgi:phospholipid/cholesterol/gamma-HCH transport system substrate-binding protein